MPDKPSLKRRVAKAGGWHLAMRLIKPIPVVGTAVIIGMAGRDIKNKGLLRGGVSVGLDLIPFVGTAKGVVEIFTGDWIPDKAPKGKRLPGKPKS
jgi:hypothetical protein